MVFGFGKKNARAIQQQATKRYVAADGEPEQLGLGDVISQELGGVPTQPEPLNKDLVSQDLEGTQAVNALPLKMDKEGEDPFIDEDGVRRSGNTLTAFFHVITAVIGAGVLFLPYAMASMGWILGVISFIIFAAITLYSSQLLADLYIIDGKRQRTYTDMVDTVFGLWGRVAIAIFQQFNLVLTALAYTITASQACVTLANSYCSSHGVADGNCFNTYWQWVIIFSALQLLMSQVPNLEAFWWASAVGAAMSFGYSSIILILSWVYFDTHGTAGPMDMGSAVDTMWNVFNGLGAVLFAYSFSMILLEIQDTIRTRKGSITGPIIRMKRAVNWSVSIMTAYYCLIAIFGYLAEGNGVQPWVLDSFPEAPVWVIDLANSMVLVHMIPAYQVWSQPHFEWMDFNMERLFDKSKLLHGWVFRLWYRTIYVVFVGFLACLCPWFGVFVGVVGALGFWPATVFFPIECWIRVFKPKRAQRYFMYTLDLFCLIVTILALAGSVQLLVVSAKDFKPFSS